MCRINKVAIIMGSDSDLPIVKPGIELLKSFGIQIEVRILSAHRTPDHASEYARTARERGIGVIIGAAGKAAHLPGIMAAYTTLPVIGLPIKSSTLDGLDSLLSIVQMPKGIPVATVAINGSENAALLAVQILTLGDEKLAEALKQYRISMEDQVLAKNEQVQKELG
ncbi:MAG: 5-(carboxyamino)imidazole ribonucleotide mutase [Clostridiales bacterium]|jgi:5-(carboxyamino)imidazole ribonucleotide mutase|nr:5-(carboxyamino)imidazole ribonucleotide mutase [Clostridiales bacterium]